MPDVVRCRAVRRLVSWHAILLIGIDRYPVVIVDISELGAKVDLWREIPEVSDLILVSEKFGSLNARVVWKEPRQAGLEFVDDDAGEILKPLLQALPLLKSFGSEQ